MCVKKRAVQEGKKDDAEEIGERRPKQLKSIRKEEDSEVAVEKQAGSETD